MDSLPWISYAKKYWGIVFIIVCLFLSSVLSGCTEDSEEDTGDNFTFIALDGTEKNLRDYREKVVILNMWATSSPECLNQIAELEKAYDHYSQDDLEIFSVNVNLSDDTALITRYREDARNYYQWDLGWVFGRDDGSIWYKYHQLEGVIPTLCVFDQQGQLLFSQEGITWFNEIPLGYPLDNDLLKPLLDTLISGEEIEGDDFSFISLDGSVVQLQDYRGKVVILDMWATWCQPCLYQLIELKKAYDHYSRDDLEIFSVNIEPSENTSIILDYLQFIREEGNYDLNWIFGHDDSSGTIWYRYKGIEGGIPTLCIFDRAGKQQFFHEGVILFDEIPGYPSDTLLKTIIDDLIK